MSNMSPCRMTLHTLALAAAMSILALSPAVSQPAATSTPAPPPPHKAGYQVNYPNAAFGLPGPKYRATIDVFPGTDAEGNVTKGGLFVARTIATHLQSYEPAGVYCIEVADLEDFPDFIQGTDESSKSFSEDEKKRVLAFTGSEYSLEFVESEDGAESVLKATFRSPAGTKESEFRAPSGEDIKLAQLAALWAMQSTGIEFTEAELAPYRSMMYGGIVTSSNDPALGKLWQGDSTTASEFLTKAGDDLLVRVNAAGAFARAGKMGDFADKLVTAPTNFATTPALDYLLRAVVFDATGLQNAAMVERMAALANRPGSELIYKQFLSRLPVGMMGDDFTAQINPWRLRSPQRPIDDMRGARILQLSCQHFLGDKSWAEADPETIDAVIYYANPSSDSVARGIKNGGPVPSLVEIAFRCFVYQDRRAEIDPLFASAIEIYPGSARLWKARLKIESSRFKGSPEAARGIATKALEVAAKHPDVGLMAFEYFSEVHFRAAQEANKPMEPAELRANPDWALVQKGLELFMNGPEPAERLARVATIFTAAEDWDALTKIVSNIDDETRMAAAIMLNDQGYDVVARKVVPPQGAPKDTKADAPVVDVPADAVTEPTPATE
jgi:hypothetical protein